MNSILLLLNVLALAILIGLALQPDSNAVPVQAHATPIAQAQLAVFANHSTAVADGERLAF